MFWDNVKNDIIIICVLTVLYNVLKRIIYRESSCYIYNNISKDNLFNVDFKFPLNVPKLAFRLNKKSCFKIIYNEIPSIIILIIVNYCIKVFVTFEYHYTNVHNSTFFPKANNISNAFFDDMYGPFMFLSCFYVTYTIGRIQYTRNLIFTIQGRMHEMTLILSGILDEHEKHRLFELLNAIHIATYYNITDRIKWKECIIKNLTRKGMGIFRIDENNKLIRERDQLIKLLYDEYYRKLSNDVALQIEFIKTIKDMRICTTDIHDSLHDRPPTLWGLCMYVLILFVTLAGMIGKTHIQNEEYGIYEYSTFSFYSFLILLFDSMIFYVIEACDDPFGNDVDDLNIAYGIIDTMTYMFTINRSHLMPNTDPQHKEMGLKRSKSSYYIFRT